VLVASTVHLVPMAEKRTLLPELFWGTPDQKASEFWRRLTTGIKVIFGTRLKPKVYKIGENKIFLNNILALTINRKKTFPNSNVNSDFDAKNTAVQVNITTSQSIFDIPCEAKIQVHNEFFSSKFCGNYSSEIEKTIKIP